MKNHLHFFHLAIAAVSVAFLATSCGTQHQMVVYNPPAASTPIHTNIVADLEVSPKRISFSSKFVDGDYYSFYGNNGAYFDEYVDYCKNYCMRQALAANDSVDVLVDPQFTVERDQTMIHDLSGKLYPNRAAIGVIRKVTVTGYPAKYKNIRSVAENAVYTNNNTAESVNAPTIINTTNRR